MGKGEMTTLNRYHIHIHSVYVITRERNRTVSEEKVYIVVRSIWNCGYKTGYWDHQQSCFRYYRIHVRSIRGSCSRTHPAFGIVRV